jgi:ribosomal protein S18 acetylase RimI-like enzyme
MWMEHTRRKGWRAVAAVDAPEDQAGGELVNAPMIGVAYGYGGAPDQWWQQQVVAGMRRAGLAPSAIGSLISNYFELTELHIRPQAQGRGLGEALTRRLLANRSENNVLLSTPEIRGENNRAWRLYRRLGFADIVRGHHFAGDPRPFAILGRQLPL